MKQQILNYIQGCPKGWVFSAADFHDIGKRNTIDQNLLRLNQSGIIKKIDTGLFFSLEQHPVLGILPPSIDNIAHAYTRKFGHTIQVTPLRAANLLGLSNQVPAKHVYLTSGSNKKININNQQLIFKHACPKKLVGHDTKAGLVMQALYYFGKNHIDDNIITKIRSLLSTTDKADLQQLVKHMPTWMQQIAVKIISND